MMNKVKELRRQLHQYPELSGQEIQTAARICRFLEESHPREIITGIGGHGVAAIYEYSESGPCIVFRCELDALPIEEPNTFAHRSGIQGVSHKCGHDGHMTMVAGLGSWLKQQKFRNGRVVLLFQPAEETGAGAAAVVMDPKFKALKPDYIFALHNLPGEPLHKIITVDNYFSATVQSLAVYLKGKQSHASEPENGNNPALAMAEIIQQFAALTVPEVSAPNFALLTPVHMKLGEPDYGISAGAGELHFTLRTWAAEEMERLKGKLLISLKDICGNYGLDYTTAWFDYFPAIKNHPFNNNIIRKAAETNGFQVTERSLPFKFGEDFSWFSREFKAAMFGLGAGTDTPSLHHSDYDFPDDLLESGIRIFGAIVEGILDKEN